MPSSPDAAPSQRAVPSQRGGPGGLTSAGDTGVPPRLKIPAGAAVGVLADRVAAALVHREPGWRLPRRSALARRYNVSIPEIDAAIAELIRRSLIRRLPDGQLYRASQAEYLIPVEGIGGLRTRLDPMGGDIACQARHVSQRGAPQDVAWALGTEGDAPVRVVRCVWTSSGEPVAISTAYVPEAVMRSLPDADLASFEEALQALPDGLLPEGTAYAAAVDLELSPPQPSVARSLRLATGQSVATVAVRFEDPVANRPVALTMTMLRPDLFRIVVQAPDDQPLAAGGDGLASAWTRAAEGWEP